MTDVFSEETRSRIMSRVHSYDTKPELIVRSIIHRMGYRFRVHQDKLPGSPDIVLTRHKKVVFVHGCFWHGHKHCSRAKRPSSNESFWNLKLDKNIERDKNQQKELRRMGWRYLIIWQCEINKLDSLKQKISNFLINACCQGGQ
jgi:DNA mismatch endonuclease (patch repair protein)